MTIRFFYTVFLSLFLTSYLSAQEKNDINKLSEINPYTDYLQQIENNVKSTKSEFFKTTILTVIKETYPGKNASEYQKLQETAGSDPLFLRNFTKSIIDKYGIKYVTVSIQRAFGLSLQEATKITEDPNFDKFIDFKLAQEYEEERQSYLDNFHYLVVNNQEAYLEQSEWSNNEIELKVKDTLITMLSKINVYELTVLIGEDGQIIDYYPTSELLKDLKSLIDRYVSLPEIPYVVVDSERYYVKSKHKIHIPRDQNIRDQKPENLENGEKQADFPGGIEAFYRDHVAKVISYPKEALRLSRDGVVYIQFTVETDGKLTNIKVAKGIGAGCDEEAKRVFHESPDWIPANSNGVNVRSQRVLPIRFIIGHK